MTDDAEFYIGYLPRAPRNIGRFVVRIVAALCAFGAAAAILLVLSQSPFAASTFEYQQYREYTGTIEAWPYPILLSKGHSFLLVAPGKHGFTGNSTNVRLKGALIHREGVEMLEVLPESVVQIAAANGTADATVSLGQVTLSGEIVDSKCYLGVMNPGQGKVHRDCAVRCISGGVPPAFVVYDASGQSRTILLTGAGREVLDYVAKPVQIRGSLLRKGSVYVLQTTLQGIHLTE